MVINIWRYDDAQKKARTPKRVEGLAFTTALSRARYILDIQLTPDGEAVLEQLKPISAYPNDPKGNPHRVLGQRAYNLASSDQVGQSEEIAIYGARAGLERFWHLAVSSREGDELTPDQLEHARQVILRVLGVQDCPSIWAVHGDTDNQHMHGLIVSFLPGEDRSVKFGQDWWQEACQIAAAIIERDFDFDPEPHHRLVADRTGVYCRISDTRVADENGTIIGRAEIVAMEKAQREWKQANYSPLKELANTEYNLEEGIRLLAKPRIKKAKNAWEMHESLARVGLRYIADDNGARVVANRYRPGSGKYALGQGIAASEVYANAGLKKLSNRFDASGGYQPADPNLTVRRFIMPRYNAYDDSKRKQYSETQLEREEAKALIDHLEKHNGDRYRRERDNETGPAVNENRARRKNHHREELERAKAMSAVLQQKAVASQKQPSPSPTEEGLALLWGPPPERKTRRQRIDRKQQRAAIDSRYKIEQDGAKRYFLDGQLAFIVRLRTIEIFMRKRRVQIDAAKLAGLLFATVRIAARHAMRTRFARIAEELNIPIGELMMEKVGKAHRERLETQSLPGIVASANNYEATLKERQRLRREEQLLRRATSGQSTDPASERTIDIRALLSAYDDAIQHCEGSMQPLPHCAALKKLENDIDHDTLMLSSSRYAQSHGGYTYRFLDDPVLLREYASDRSVLADFQMQLNLEAIDAIQRDKRRWIAAAIASGNASIENGRLKMTDGERAWAQNFWQAQGQDPKMRRLIGVARARPELFPFDPDERPGDRALAHIRNKNDPLVLRIKAMRQAQEERFYGPERRTPATATGPTTDAPDQSAAREASRPKRSSQKVAGVALENAKSMRSTVRKLPLDHDQGAKR